MIDSIYPRQSTFTDPPSLWWRLSAQFEARLKGSTAAVQSLRQCLDHRRLLIQAALAPRAAGPPAQPGKRTGVRRPPVVTRSTTLAIRAEVERSASNPENAVRKVDLRKLIEEVNADLHWLRRDRHISIQTNLFGSHEIVIDRPRAHVALLGLLLNSATSLLPRTTIELNAGTFGSALEIEISDDGQPDGAHCVATRCKSLELILQHLLPGVVITELKCPQGGVAIELTVPLGRGRQAA